MISNYNRCWSLFASSRCVKTRVTRRAPPRLGNQMFGTERTKKRQVVCRKTDRSGAEWKKSVLAGFLRFPSDSLLFFLFFNCVKKVIKHAQKKTINKQFPHFRFASVLVKKSSKRVLGVMLLLPSPPLRLRSHKWKAEEKHKRALAALSWERRKFPPHTDQHDCLPRLSRRKKIFFAQPEARWISSNENVTAIAAARVKFLFFEKAKSLQKKIERNRGEKSCSSGAKRNFQRSQRFSCLFKNKRSASRGILFFGVLDETGNGQSQWILKKK